MANQPPQTRPWFRFPSLARPAPESIPTPAAAPELAPVQPRPVIARPAFRPALPTAQPQEPTQARPPPAATGQPPAAASPTAALVQKSPPKPGGGGVVSVPSSPVQRAPAPTASLPTTPVQTATRSVQTSPRPRVSAPTSSVPSSPVLRPAQTSSVPTSPVTKPMPTTISVPTSPPPKPAPVTSSVPTSPANKAVTTTTTTTARVPSSVQYPRTVTPAVQSPPRSPKLNPTAPPPSPLILPPAKIKSDAETDAKIPLVPEQKTVLVQKTFDKPKHWLDSGNSEKYLAGAVKSSIGHHGKHETLRDHGESKEKVQHKKIFSDSEDGGMRVITIAGENKGAFMEVIRSPNKKHVFEGSPHYLIHKKDGDDSKSDGNKWKSYSRNSSSGSEGEGKTKMKNKSHKGKEMNSLPTSTFMNSNVQGVNNSIVYNSSCTHHDPGIHLALSRKPASGEIHVKDRSNGVYHD